MTSEAEKTINEMNVLAQRSLPPDIFLMWDKVKVYYESGRGVKMEATHDKYASVREKFKNGDWVTGTGEHTGCSEVFDIDTSSPQPFSYLDATNPDDFRLATKEEIAKATH